ncbi:ricin-type beta-trefoil lectin domain protein [Glycomyces tenuis]|uniref:ricin-type beta-trefoil lectin domain protein n=2 Tax=Glycomyces tenuis TaxID=58116 RepID=UPI0003FA1C23|nr:ricin-type beta-trefoil lectin domain protein [Glycomyces tenuis]
MRFLHRHDAPRRRRRRTLISVLAALALVPVTVLAGAGTANADTSQFRGFNWAVLGDNFQTGPLVLDGLDASDDYETVRAKADTVYDAFESQFGANTVRLPINTHTVGSAWWNAYRATIDAATDRGFKVILAYWEDGVASGGRITDMAAFNSMWSTVTSTYGPNELIYFEPMNEPHGYSSQEWRDLAADWLDYHYSAPPGRVLIGGVGFSQDLRPICDDPRFDGTLLSLHHYSFDYGERTFEGWIDHIESRLGDCASRAIPTEFGAPMDSGLDYGDPNSTNNYVRYIRAMTEVMRTNDMGGVYWPAIGGKTNDTYYDFYSMFELTGSGTDLRLTVRNPSAADRLRYGWGDDIDGGRFTAIVNRNSGKCLDVAGASTEDGAEIIQYDCHGGSNQQWRLRDLGGGYHQVVSQTSGKCLDVDLASTADGAAAILWPCTGGRNQQWELREVGGFVELVARHSGRCLEVLDQSTADAAPVQQYSCWGGANQQWTIAT